MEDKFVSPVTYWLNFDKALGPGLRLRHSSLGSQMFQKKLEAFCIHAPCVLLNLLGCRTKSPGRMLCKKIDMLRVSESPPMH